MGGLSKAYNGCECLCHKQPGVMHFLACCGSDRANSLPLSMQPKNTPDPEEDFDGAIGELFKQAVAEHNSIPEHLRTRFYMRKACEAVLNALNLDYPDIILSQQLQRLVRNAQQLEASIPEESRWTEAEDTRP